jgi:hypothetical protein
LSHHLPLSELFAQRSSRRLKINVSGQRILWALARCISSVWSPWGDHVEPVDHFHEHGFRFAGATLPEGETALGIGRTCCFQNTQVTCGSAAFLVTASGASTQMGKIAGMVTATMRSRRHFSETSTA